MSYCRFTDGDVYAYECEGGVQFWTANEGLNRLCNTFNEAYQYAMFLRDGYGLDVPSYAIEALKADALDEARRICGPDSAVAEIEHEKGKLRGLVRIMAYCMQQGRECDGCAMNDAKGAVTEHVGCDGLRYVLSELGIEEDS